MFAACSWQNAFALLEETFSFLEEASFPLGLGPCRERDYRLRKASQREPLMYFGLPKLGSLSIVFGMRPEVERRPLHVQNRIRRSHCQMLARLIDALSESWSATRFAMFSTTTNNNSQEIPTPKKNKICPSRGLRH